MIGENLYAATYLLSSLNQKMVLHIVAKIGPKANQAASTLQLILRLDDALLCLFLK